MTNSAQSAPTGPFKTRFAAMATQLAMASGVGVAQEIWLKTFRALQATHAGFQSAPTAGKTARKDLGSDVFRLLAT